MTSMQSERQGRPGDLILYKEELIEPVSTSVHKFLAFGPRGLQSFPKTPNFALPAGNEAEFITIGALKEQ